jgi:hypothetical protein
MQNDLSVDVLSECFFDILALQFKPLRGDISRWFVVLLFRPTDLPIDIRVPHFT